MNDLSELEQIYTDTTKQLISSFNQSEKNELIEFYPFVAQIGKNFKNSNYKMMFIGKATNGWLLDVSCSSNEQAIEKFYKNVAFNMQCKDRLLHRDDEMQWVENLEGNHEGYNTKRSQFWNVIKKVSEALEGTENWSSKIAWSNLYKFAPFEGNPTGALKRYQKESCWRILDEEINIIRPKCIVFLTSGWEKDYLTHKFKSLPKVIPSSFGEENKRTYSLSFFHADGIIFISSKHPQGKPVQEHADKLCEIISG